MAQFSKQNYRSLLSLALDRGYRVIPFAKDPATDGRVVYLRHDVDFSLEFALEMARVNASAGVKGLFCLLVRSQIYNLLSPWSLQVARRIHELGQALALHYAAPAPLPATDNALSAAIAHDHYVLRHELPMAEPVFSWHNPSPQLLERGRKLEVPGLVNTYGTRYADSVPYFSDSNARNTFKDFETILCSEKYHSLQLLFHPVVWIAGGETMTDVLANAWRQIIREREYEVSTNRAYQAALPHGMPDSLLDLFERRWREEASQVSPQAEKDSKQTI